MKNSVKYLSLLLACLFVFTSCDEELIEYSEINLEVVDGFLNVLTPNIPFLAGTESYTMSFLVVPGIASVQSVNVYKQFNDASSGNSSDEQLLGTYDVNLSEASTLFEETITFAQLREGLTLNGGPLPTDEIEITIGSTWTLRVVAVDAAGNESGLASGTINVAVLSPYAGDYEVYESGYWRIGVPSGLGDWSGDIRFIGSVDAVTYRHADYVGPLGPATGFPSTSWIFYLNEDFSITIPDEVDGVTQPNFGTYFVTCESDPALFANAPCAGSNELIIAGDGAHEMRLTYGYFNVSGDENEGVREFYEYMTKVID